MPTYCIKHVLPDGTIAGYTADSCGAVVSDKGRAKTIVAASEADATKWLSVVRKNFAYVWNLESSEFGGGPEYRAYACWKGCTLDQIRTEIELFSQDDVRFPLVFSFID